LKKAILTILLVLIADQGLKFWIKTNFYLGEEIHVLGNWFILHFTENNGMAFGLQFGGQWGKLFLSIFRIIAVAGIGWYLFKLVKEKAPSLVIITLSLIFAGAIGNIIDSLFYGIIFTDSYNQIAQFIPENGYAGLLHGKVVDMLYFPILQGHFPDWVPVWGSEEFIFFRPVFNLADASITVGVFLILLFQRKFFSQ
jgi:signal peptidase II